MTFFSVRSFNLIERIFLGYETESMIKKNRGTVNITNVEYDLYFENKFLIDQFSPRIKETNENKLSDNKNAKMNFKFKKQIPMTKLLAFSHLFVKTMSVFFMIFIIHFFLPELKQIHSTYKNIACYRNKSTCRCKI